MGLVLYEYCGGGGGGTSIVVGINRNASGFNTNADLLLSKNSL